MPSAIDWAGRSRRSVLVIGACCLAVGLCVLVAGWRLGIHWIAAPIPGKNPMLANAAAGIAVAGLGVLAAAARWPRWISWVAGCAVGALGAATLMEYATGSGWRGLDELLAADPGLSAASSPGRMAISTALNLMLIGAALVLLGARRLHGVRQGLGAAVSFMAFGVLLGFAMTDLVETGPGATPWTQTAPLTALCVMLLGVAAAAADIRAGWAEVFVADTAGGRLVRVAAPGIAGLALAAAVLVRLVLHHDVLRPHAAQLTIVFMSAVGAVVLLAASRRETAAERARLLDRQHLADSEHRYRLVAENASDVVLLISPEWELLWVSPATKQVLGYDPAELIATNTDRLVHPEDLPLLASWRAAAIGVEGKKCELRVRNAAGQYRWMSGVSRDIHEGGAVVGRASALRDIHDEVLARDELAASEQRYRLLAEHATDVVGQVDADGVLVWVSPSIRAELGWSPGEVLGTNVCDLIHPADQDETAKWNAKLLAGATPQNLESRLLAADGSCRWMSLRGRATTGTDGSVTGLIVGMRDIDDEVGARTALSHAIEHDPLTGLATLPVFEARINRLLAELPEHHPGRSVGVLCVGVDQLKAINEALNHAAGDVVLMEIAARIATVIGNQDLLARRPGDEFLVLLPDLVSGADASVIAERVRIAARGTVTIGGSQFEPTVSVGIATGSSGDRCEEIVRDSALAMHQAKVRGRDCCEFFQPLLAEEARRRVIIEDGIRIGLRDGQFVPWFQPVVNLLDGAVVGYEALVRWVRPDGSIVAPDDFLPVAERSSLMADLDSAVLRQSVDLLSRLPAPMHVAVNVSAATLARADYAHWVIEALARAGVDPPRLHLEFTETSTMYVTDRIYRLMRELAEAGVRWYVDDFGTGYSSISHLRDLPVAGLKLDLSFTAGIRTGDRTSERLARALTGLADGLGLDTVAEGVETPEEAAILISQGWKHAQGWLYGHAEPAAAIPRPRRASADDQAAHQGQGRVAAAP